MHCIMTIVEIARKTSLITMAKNAVESQQFKSLYAVIDGEERDILRNGIEKIFWFNNFD